jgi:hypothetical protein
MHERTPASALTKVNTVSITFVRLLICADDPIILDDQGMAEALDDDLAGAFDS